MPKYFGEAMLEPLGLVHPKGDDGAGQGAVLARGTRTVAPHTPMAVEGLGSSFPVSPDHLPPLVLQMWHLH